MPSSPEWEYTYRWVDGLDVNALEARDQALEAHLRSFGSACSIDFEYSYRWDQILAAPTPRDQINLLEANMQALEAAVTASGGCVLEFPYRWSQFWEGLLAGESWAVACAEENDQAIEYRFSRCTCATFAAAWDNLFFPSPASQTSEVYTVTNDAILSTISYGLFIFAAGVTYPITLTGYRNGVSFYSAVISENTVLEDYSLDISVSAGDEFYFTMTGDGSAEENTYSLDFLDTGLGLILDFAGTGTDGVLGWVP